MKLVYIMLMTLSISLSFGQTEGPVAREYKQQDIQLVFNQQDFENRFSVLSHSDENYDYYVVDLTRFNDRFERVYFMNLTYSESKLVNLDADLDKEQTWFKTYYSNKETEVTCLFNNLMEKTQLAGKGMSDVEKSAWLAKNDKFKKEK